MLLFFNELINIIAMTISIQILLHYRLSIKMLILMTIGAQLIAYPLFPVLDASSILISLVFIIFCVYRSIRNIQVSISIPVLTMILFVITNYFAELGLIYFWNDAQQQMLQGNNFVVLAFLCITGLFAIGLSIVGKKLFYKFKGHDLFFQRYGILFTVLSAVTLIIFYVNIYIGKQQGFSDANIEMNSLLFLIYFAILLVVFIVLSHTVYKVTMLQNKQLQYERLKEYTDNLEQLYNDMQKFRHDYINILLTMSEYIRTRDIDNLEAYFEQKIMPISKGMESNNFKLGALHNVKVQEVKGIFSSKLIKAQELAIDTGIEVVEPMYQFNMDSVKLCRCLGIILDNAIEEAVRCEVPMIRVALIQRDSAKLIVVTNSCKADSPELYKIYEKGFSTKGSDRGLGLSNLKEIISQCDNVTLDTQIQHGHFIQEIEIYD
ncbi:GHKL domain-containing protein [Paenibacillus sp. N1-5-1-14]|uniref:sensor histidine kinase n=1 Tax=Paenibacillus radicibacter TaxID=2972488 RepID=UPI00215930DA|nr:GHKL domain-containing protein [Paenibacillus radicibacter]MCR8644652.1 GHKL domain-containing protein [Paenibacillus radicibacter]